MTGIYFGGGVDQSSAYGGFDITPSDSVALTYVTRLLRATTAGTIAVVFKDGSNLTITFSAGEALPICVTQVKSTGTTATGIQGFY